MATPPTAITLTGDSPPVVPGAITSVDGVPSDPVAPVRISRAVAIESISTAENTITLTGSHGLIQNQAFKVSAATQPGGLPADTDFYADIIDATTIRPLATPGGAVVNITSAGSGSRQILASVLSKTDSTPTVPTGINQSAAGSPTAPPAISQSGAGNPTVPTGISQSGAGNPTAPEYGISKTLIVDTVLTAENALEFILSHGMTENQAFRVESTEELPAGLEEDTVYYAGIENAETIVVLSSPGGDEVNITDVGEGEIKVLTSILSKIETIPTIPTGINQTGASNPSAPPAIEQSADSAPTAPPAITQAAGSTPSAPTGITQAAGDDPDAPPAIAQDGATIPTAPSGIVIEGEQEPVSVVVAPDSPTEVAHTYELDAQDNYRVLVGSRGAPVTITLPDPPGSGQWIEIVDNSMQADEYAITIDPGGRTIEGENEWVMDVKGSVLEIYFNGTSWKIL